jgi:hypothetical protein
MAWTEICDGIIEGGLRPTFPEDTDPNWRELITWCWDQDPVVRPNFELIVRHMGSPEFIGPRVDLERFRAYQRTVVPDELQ